MARNCRRVTQEKAWCGGAGKEIILTEFAIPLRFFKSDASPAWVVHPDSMKKGLIIGCSVLAGLALLIFVIVVAWVIYVAQDVKGMAVKVEGGSTAQKGKEFELVVRVTNERSTKPLKLADIDFSEDYLKGFVLVSTEPEAKAYQHVPVVNNRSFTFDATIPAKGEQAFKFKLRPVDTGVYQGNLQVSEGMRSVTTMVETEVK
jgi:hypothetical protein